MSQPDNRVGQPPLDQGFWLFLAGQAVSKCGTAATRFVIPLIIYHLTGSSLALALAAIASYLPYTLLGLVLGAYADRVDRKRLMIATDLARAAMVASIPLASWLSILSLTWVYVAILVISALTVAFEAAGFAAVPSLARGRDGLIVGNARLQASLSTANVAGPLLGGVALAVMPAPTLLLADAISYLLSAGSPPVIRQTFNAERTKPRGTITSDIVDGLRFVWRDAILRNLALMTAIINFFFITTTAQLVLLAKQVLRGSNAEIGWLYAAGAAGTVLLSLAARRLSARVQVSRLVLASLLANGLLTILLSQTHTYAFALVLWGGVMGTASLFAARHAGSRC